MWKKKEGRKERRRAQDSCGGGEKEQIQHIVFQLSLTSTLLFSSEISLSPTEKRRLWDCTSAGLVVLLGEVGVGHILFNAAKCDIIAM